MFTLILLGGTDYLIGTVLGSLSCLVQRCEFNLPVGRIFPAKGIFSKELPWVFDSIPLKLFQMRV